jgi:hypothetical protein
VSGKPRSAQGVIPPSETAIYEEVVMPIILWLVGVPITLVLALWFFGIVGF